MLKFPKACLRQTTKDWQGMHSGHQKYYARLAHHYYGHFQILERSAEIAYRLKLPPHWHIHNAFHVSLLKVYKGNPPMVIEDPPRFYEREEILQPKVILRHKDKVLCNSKVLCKY